MAAKAALKSVKPGEETNLPRRTSSKALRLVHTPRSARPFAFTLTIFIVLVTVCLILVPWQQSVNGAGQTIVFSPMERPQNIEAQISGRVKKWHVTEGQMVKAGDLIAEIAETDQKFLDPNQLDRLEEQRKNLITRREAAELRAASLSNQMESLGRARNAAIPSARERAKQAQDRLRAAEQSLAAGQQKLLADKLNFERIRDLNQGKKNEKGEWVIQPGLRSDRDFELARQTYEQSKNDVERLQATLEAAKRDITTGNFDAERVENDTAAGLSSVQASLASAKETIASINNDLQKIEIDIRNFSERIGQRTVRASRDGQVTQLKKVGDNETVKSGSVLCVLVPQLKEEEQSVEMYLSDFDAPLVRVGDPVRIQFEGFPAIQFVGWPSVAIGTFGGRIVTIDQVDDGANRFRLIIKPDLDAVASKRDDPWPNTSFLRPGTQATGWVMLRTVPLWYELWRQFNGFPPNFDRSPIEKRKPKDKKDKNGSKEKDKGEKDDGAKDEK
jgi:multidrug efflux pump subunit AcrA (membrane-fusion protein)